MNTITKKTNGSQSHTEKLEVILDRLSGVQPRGDSYRAHCPAHDDTNPSLVIKSGYRGVLLRCWAGCTLAEICQAIGLQESDLFFDAPQSQTYKNNGTAYERANLNFKWDWKRQTGELLAIVESRAILAEIFLEQVKDINSNTITDEQRDSLLEKIALAWSWLRVADEAGELCFQIAHRMRKTEVIHG